MKPIKNKSINKKQKLILRILIVVGTISILNFFYWFLQSELVENRWLYGMLMALFLFDSFRVIYIWYHYWNLSYPEKPQQHKSYSVDIFTTYFPGEPLNMVKDTLLAVKQLKYPNKTIYLCDEENNHDLRTFCKENDVIHVTRDNLIDAKAGNINNALEQATGEICLILDPDHKPFPDFLDEVVPYFEDESVGFVQTVQSYYNLDASRVAQAAAEQTFQFYGPVMMSMNSYGTVNAIGANCVFRRKALDSIDGHAAGLSEDMHTAMRLHAKGWKSIYLPKALSAGLAPNTLSAYYKQQLKWSRGTFELLFAVYPKLFKSFSFRQKIHYGILPLHYLAGLFFMISFLIPILALTFSTTPWKGNLINFGMIALPVLISIISVRLYSQHWVIRKSERGFHVLGGLLLQCTWWVYIIGVFYTFIRRKVPYIPTLKDDTRSTSLSIVMPNLIVGILCIAAIVYGLLRDFTPFSMAMAGFALWNAAIMFFTISFAKDRPKQIVNKGHFQFQRKHSVRFPSRVFHLWNRLALVTILLTIGLAVFFQMKNLEIREFGYTKVEKVKDKTHYLGIFYPTKDNGISNVKSVSRLSDRLDVKFDIVSFYIPWHPAIDSTFQWKILDSVYNNHALPLITWEPWVNAFTEFNENEHVYDLILSGQLDYYIRSFAQKLKTFNRPIFLRFAHEFDNPFYTWYDSLDNAEERFQKTWRYVHAIFEEERAEGVIWVWNPWKTENMLDYFPGEAYVDWIGVNILNYATSQDSSYAQFKTLYKPYRDKIKKLPKLPVMITEMGTLKDTNTTDQWLNNAISDINRNFKEIDALIYFNSNVDNNHKDGYESEVYNDWTLPEQVSSARGFKSKDVPDYIFDELKSDEANPVSLKVKQRTLEAIKGVNLVKGEKWKEDYHVLNREHLEEDFKKMKGLGLNTIKYKDNKVYRYNVVQLSKEYGLKLSYGFELPLTINFVKDSLTASKLKRDILQTIKKLNDEHHVISWHLHNDVLQNQLFYYNKPDLLYQNQAFVQWLDDLIVKIYKIDNRRPVVVDLEINNQTEEHIKMLEENLQNEFIFGLIFNNSNEVNRDILNLFKSNDLDYIFSVVPASLVQELDLVSLQHSFFLTEWQDQHRINYVSFGGLIDRNGRKKIDYFELENLIRKKHTKDKMFKINIIKPLRGLVEGFPEYYYAMILNEHNKWEYVKERKDLITEWSLLKLGANGNFISVKNVGTKPILQLKTPRNYKSYYLELSVTKRGVTKNYITTLNTPYILQ